LSAFTKSVGVKTKLAVDLISDALPFGLLYDGPNGVANAIGICEA
jgi:hypothetical protein